MERRDFLKRALLGSMFFQSLQKSVFALDFFNPYSVSFQTQYLVNSFRDDIGSTVNIFNVLRQEIVARVRLDFTPHTATRVSEHCLFFCAKFGTSSAVVDLKRNKVLASHRYRPDESTDYMGHGLYDPDKNVLYTTHQTLAEEMDSDCFKGFVNVRDPLTLAVKSSFPTFGHAPHDIAFSKDGNLVVCNGSALYPSLDKYSNFWTPQYRNVAHINSSDFSLIRRIGMPNKDICPSHIKTYGGGMVVSGIFGKLLDTGFLDIKRTWEPVFIDNNFQTSELIQGEYVPYLFNSEHLSIAIDEISEVVGVTIPNHNAVNFWSLKDQKFLAHVPLTFPKGIFLHPKTKKFWVYTDSGIKIINSKNFQIEYVSNINLGNGLAHTYLV